VKAVDQQPPAPTVPRPPDDRPVRVFLVGSPRSGTTLLRALLAAHSQVASFPETHFFDNVVRAEGWRHGGWRRRLGIPLPDAPNAIDRLVALGIVEPNQIAVRHPPATIREYAELLTEALDEVARASHASHWLEKTPDHLHYVREIERYIPGSRIVHMIRSGRAVVASLFDAQRTRPDIWGQPRTISNLVKAWGSDLRRSRACIGRPNHTFVSYERLVADPGAVMGRLCPCLRLPADESTVERMLRDYPLAGMRSTGSVRSPMHWDGGVAGDIGNRNDAKFYALFSVSERAQIDHALAAEARGVDAFPFL
jgi:Sulfotransferase family